ncbi:MAG: CRISPR system precrRNA processing endoribonuclease RAMP protein Cas6 [Desulfuromonadaceae bacterium]
MDLDFVRIECDVTADSATQLTTLLHEELRNFEAHFKTSSCLTSLTACPSCSEQDGCPFRIVFSQRLSSDPEIVRLHQKPPLPFALYVEERGSDCSAGAVSVGLVVIGTAVNYVEPFHTALRGMIDTAVGSVLDSEKYSLRTYTLDYQGVRHELSHGTSFPDGVMILSGHHILHNSVNSESIRISLKSPLRLLCNGSIVHLFDFAAFFRSQMRRCSSLCAYYGSGELNLDFVKLSDLAQKVAVFDDQIRYSQPQWSMRQNRAGLSGSAECSGLVESMSALLFLGSFFNAGKGATYGSGQYEVVAM